MSVAQTNATTVRLGGPFGVSGSAVHVALPRLSGLPSGAGRLSGLLAAVCYGYWFGGRRSAGPFPSAAFLIHSASGSARLKGGGRLHSGAHSFRPLRCYFEAQDGSSNLLYTVIHSLNFGRFKVSFVAAWDYQILIWARPRNCCCASTGQPGVAAPAHCTRSDHTPLQCTILKYGLLIKDVATFECFTCLIWR